MNSAGETLSPRLIPCTCPLRIIAIASIPRQVLNRGAIFSTAKPGSKGKGGDIHITTSSLLLTGAIFLADTSGQSSAGNIILDVRDRATFDRSTIASNVGPDAQGKGGDIHITTGSLLLTNHTIVQATLLERGNAGNVIINARDRVAMDGSAIFSNVGGFGRSTVAVGNAGKIEITTPSLSLTNGAQLQSLTLGQGDAQTRKEFKVELLLLP